MLSAELGVRNVACHASRGSSAAIRVALLGGFLLIYGSSLLRFSFGSILSDIFRNPFVIAEVSHHVV